MLKHAIWKFFNVNPRKLFYYHFLIFKKTLAVLGGGIHIQWYGFLSVLCIWRLRHGTLKQEVNKILTSKDL